MLTAQKKNPKPTHTSAGPQTDCNFQNLEKEVSHIENFQLTFYSPAYYKRKKSGERKKGWSTLDKAAAFPAERDSSLFINKKETAKAGGMGAEQRGCGWRDAGIATQNFPFEGSKFHFEGGSSNMRDCTTTSNGYWIQCHHQRAECSGLITQAKINTSVPLIPFLRPHKKALPGKGHGHRQSLEM